MGSNYHIYNLKQPLIYSRGCPEHNSKYILCKNLVFRVSNLNSRKQNYTLELPCWNSLSQCACLRKNLWGYTASKRQNILKASFTIQQWLEAVILHQVKGHYHRLATQEPSSFVIGSPSIRVPSLPYTWPVMGKISERLEQPKTGHGVDSQWARCMVPMTGKISSGWTT